MRKETECHPIILALTASTTYISSDRSRTDVSQRRGRDGNESSKGSPTHDFGLQGRFSVVEMTDETERHTRIYTGASRSLLLRTACTSRARGLSEHKDSERCHLVNIDQVVLESCYDRHRSSLVTDMTDKPKTQESSGTSASVICERTADYGSFRLQGQESPRTPCGLQRIQHKCTFLSERYHKRANELSSPS